MIQYLALTDSSQIQFWVTPSESLSKRKFSVAGATRRLSNANDPDQTKQKVDFHVSASIFGQRGTPKLP